MFELECKSGPCQFEKSHLSYDKTLRGLERKLKMSKVCFHKQHYFNYFAMRKKWQCRKQYGISIFPYINHVKRPVS